MRQDKRRGGPQTQTLWQIVQLVLRLYLFVFGFPTSDSKTNIKNKIETKIKKEFKIKQSW